MEEIALQTQWGTLVAIYLFLGGLAGGTLTVSGVLTVKGSETMRSTVRFGAWAGVILLIVGVLCLLFETTMPVRAIQLWSAFTNPSSWMTIGAWLLVCGIVASGLFALSCTPPVVEKAAFLGGARKVLAIISGVLGICIALYTGILLCVLLGHPLWNTFLLPVLFLVSAMDTGVALILVRLMVDEGKGVPGSDAALSDDEGGAAGKDVLADVRLKLEKVSLVLIIIELIVLVIWLALVASGSDVGAVSVALLTSGPLAPWFWVLLVLCGLAAPGVVAVMAITHHAALKPPLMVAGPVLCLIGGCALRFLVLLAGLPLWAL